MMKAKKITTGQRVMSNILRISYINGINNEWLADLLGCTTRTLQVRKKNPETLTLKEIDDFCSGTHTEIDEVLK